MSNEVYISQEATLLVRANTNPYATVAAPVYVRNVSYRKNVTRSRLTWVRSMIRPNYDLEGVVDELSFDVHMEDLSALDAVAFGTAYRIDINFLNTITAQNETKTIYNSYITMSQISYADNDTVQRRVIFTLCSADATAKPTAVLDGTDISGYLSRYSARVSPLRPQAAMRALAGNALTFYRGYTTRFRLEFDRLTNAQYAIVAVAYLKKSTTWNDGTYNGTVYPVGDDAERREWWSNHTRMNEITVEFEV